MTGSELEKAGRNYLGFLEGEDGYFSFIRFTSAQVRLYNRDPLFRNLSLCSSGVYLSLICDGDRLVLDCRTMEIVGKILPALAEMGWDGLKDIVRDLSRKLEQGAPLPRLRDKFDLVTEDGQLVSRMPKNGRISFEFRNVARRPLRLRLYFPVFPYVAVRRLDSNGGLAADGTILPRILCLGDSITQGFNASHPSKTWVARLSEMLGVDALNQGVGGYYFDAASLDGLEALSGAAARKIEGPERPALITVAYGTNDWDLVPELSILRERVRAYFDRLEGLFPGTPVLVLSPIWRGDLDQLKACGTLEDLSRVIAEEAGRHPDNRLVDGLGIPIHDRKYFQDNWLHPNEEGFRIMAEQLHVAIAASDSFGAVGAAARSRLLAAGLSTSASPVPVASSPDS